MSERKRDVKPALSTIFLENLFIQYAYIFMMIETESRHKLVDFLCHGACVQINWRSARMHKNPAFIAKSNKLERLPKKYLLT